MFHPSGTTKFTKAKVEKMRNKAKKREERQYQKQTGQQDTEKKNIVEPLNRLYTSQCGYTQTSVKEQEDI